MTDASSIAEIVAIPPPPSGWFDFGYAALADGSLALTRTRGDFHTLRRSAGSGRRSPVVQPHLAQSSDVRVSVFDGEAETDAVVVRSGLPLHVDRMANGRWLVATPSAGSGNPSARIFSPTGEEEQALDLGYGIAHLLCAPNGTIWVGYIDEGVFARQHADESWPVSTGGIVQFDASGTPRWSFNHHVRNSPSRTVADCYAMTLSGNTLWSSYYTDFPIVRVEQGKAVFWENAVAGARAIAVKDDMVMLAGGYREDAGRVAVVCLERDFARHLGSLGFAPPAQGSAGLIQGRGATMHVVADGWWSRFSVHRATRLLR